MSADATVEAARKMIGTRWRHQGRKPWAVDCVGLLVLSMESAGWPKFDAYNGYGRDPWDDRLRKTLQANFGNPVADMQPGDVGLVRWGRAEPSHVGIIADYVWGGHSIIHAHNLHGVVETSLSGEIADSIVDIYRPDWSKV